MKNYLWILFAVFIAVLNSSAKAQKDFGTIINELSQAMKAGDLDAAAILADLRVDNFLTDSEELQKYDAEEWRALVEKSYKNNSPFGAYVYGIALQLGYFGVKIDEEKGKSVVSKAIPELRKLADQGNSFAWLHLFYAYSGQSSEGVKQDEMMEALAKGEALGNPVCTFAACELILTNAKSPEEVEDGFNKLEILHKKYRFKEKHLKQLYASCVNSRFDATKFDLRMCEDNIRPNYRKATITTVFRDDALKTTIIFGFQYDNSNAKIYPRPTVSVEFSEISHLGQTAGSRPNRFPFLSWKLDDATSVEVANVAQQGHTWDSKAKEIRPPWFRKKLGAPSGGYPNLYFEWDGIASASFGFTAKGGWTLSEFLMLAKICIDATNPEDKRHGFFQATEDSFFGRQKSDQKKKALIDENFK